MHCVSCETLIEKEIKAVFKVFEIDICHKKGKMEIEMDEFQEARVKEIIEKCGYQVVDKGKVNFVKRTKFNIKDFSELILVLAIIFFIASLLSRFDLFRLFPSVSDKVGILVALGLGVVASLSTCLAITGGIVMSFSSRYKLGKNISFLNRSRPQIYFHLGRITGFFVLGGLLGLIGEGLQYSNSFAGFLTILVALIMLYVAFNILGILPSITKLGFYFPKKWSRGISSWPVNNNPIFISSIGVLTFFLPCGFTQSMQLVAVASGSFFAGAFIMMAFAIGTLPVLFSIGIGSSYAQNKKFSLMKKFVAVIIIIFALYSLNSGLVMSGSRYSLDFWSKFDANASIASIKDQESQTVQLDIDFGFRQREFRIKKDVPVKFIVNAIRVTGCSDEIIISSLGLSTGKLKSGEKGLIEFTPTQTGIIPFSCWMGMINGRFIVE